MTASVSLTRRAPLTRLPVTPFGPASVAGLQFWIKADALPVVADGTDVTTWPDSSSGGNNASFLGTKAKYYNSVVNGLPAVRWVAGDSRYASAASASDPAQSIFVVANIASLAANRNFIGPSANGGMSFYAKTDGGLSLQIAGVTFAGSSSASAVSAGSFLVASCTVTSGACGFWVNGTAKGTSNGTYTLSAATTVLGAQVASQIFAGDIAEIIRYTGVVSSADRIALHAYLGAKYGITMGGS